MKRRVKVLIDVEILQLAKQRAAEEGRPLNDLIQDALVKYLRKDEATPEERKIAFQFFCERPLRISDEQLRQVLEVDGWDP